MNSDLVGKYINIASRCAGFITRKFDGKLTATISEGNRKWFKRFIFCQLNEEDAFLGRHNSMPVILRNGNSESDKGIMWWRT